MTQAYNLSQLANFINASGKLSNSGLQNSSFTVSAGSGLSGGGSVSLGGSVTLNNTGVTSLSGGTGISVSGSTGGVTVTNTGVTSVNGNSGAVTLPVPGIAFNTIYSYGYFLVPGGAGANIVPGNNYAGSYLQSQYWANGNGMGGYSTMSGTWQFMSTGTSYGGYNGLFFRIA
jgi:hypothetical protein